MLPPHHHQCTKAPLFTIGIALLLHHRCKKGLMEAAKVTIRQNCTL